MSRILVLEDEPGFQQLLAEVLGEAGHEVLAATSGQQALDLVEQQRPDLLLVDNRMPGLWGMEFLKRYREAGNEQPAIIMTAYADVPVVVDAMRLGAADFLVKPFGIDALMPLVDRYLQPATAEAPTEAAPRSDSPEASPPSGEPPAAGS